MNTISIIIATKDRYSLLRHELECLRRQTYKNFKVFIVDDRSSDETSSIDVSEFRKDFFVEVYHSNVHLNMIRARNKGLEIADRNSDYFLILDDDNAFENDFLERFALFFKQYPNFGLIEPKNYHKDRKSIWYFGCDYNLSNMYPHFGRTEFDNDFKKVDAVANCFFINVQLFSQLGYFDPKYVIDLSEAEYAFRAKAYGFDSVVANVPIYHQSTEGKEKLEMFKKRIDSRPETYYYIFRNKYLFVSEFGSWWNRFVFNCFFQFLTFAGYIFVSLRIGSFKLFKLYCKGFFAGNYYLFTGKLLLYK